MKNRFTYRSLSLLMAWMLLFTLLPVQAIAGETSGLSVRATASVSHVYVGEGAVAITAEIAGGAAPYEVTIQAVQNGNVVFKDQMMTTETRVTACFTPASNGDYELVTVVCDVEQNQVLDSVSLAVAEHDAETEADWAASVSGASVSGDWASSLLSVARSQLGYRESGKDFIVKFGAKQGYTRYGDWFGMPYGDWNNAFLLFAAEYAGIPGDALLSGASSSRWRRAMQAKGAYMTPGSYVPQVGDVAFLSGGRAAVIERVSGDNVQVIEGDVKGEVVRKNYAVSKLAGIGNTRLMMGLYRGTATAVPAAPAQTPADGKPAWTAAPAAKPTVTPEPAEEEELTFTATATPRPGMTTAPKEDGTPLDDLIDAAGGTVAQLQAAATSVPTAFSEAFYLMQAEVHKVTERYLGEGEKEKGEIKSFADKLTLPEVYYLRVEMDALEDYAASIGLMAWEGNALWEREETFRRLNEAVEDRWISLVQPRAEQILLDGKATFSYSTGDITMDGDDSLTWKKILRASPFKDETGKYTFSITNNHDCDAMLSFDWAGEGFNEIFGASISTIGTSGSIQQELTAGAAYTFTAKVKAAAGKEQTSILTLTNITLTPEAQNGCCTLQFDAEKGSVTVNGAAAANGSGWDVDASAGLALTAAATEGCRFLGWADQADGKVLSCEESFTLQASGEISVEAVFVKEGETTWFGVSDRGTSGDMATGYTSHVNKPVFLFDDLSKAADCAAAGQYPCIVLLNGGTLPAGSYTISEKVTLLIPFDDARTLYLGSPALTGEKTTPQAYRTLNMAAGASLKVNGTLSLSAKHQYASAEGGSARPIGSYGQIAMAEGSSITVGSGGKLYVWGYITGKGEVTAESGAEVYEVFQIADFRGAVAQSMKNGVYPFSQYYVQNIEVPLKLYAGATEYGLTSASVSGTASSSTFPFMGGSGAMFQQTSGYLMKDYRESADRLTIDAYGSMTLSGLQMELAGVRVDAADFVLPVNSNMTVTAHSGKMTIDQDLALLPGAELVIGTAAEAVIAQDCSVYAYDAEDWGAYAWSGGTDAKLWVAPYAPGRESTRTAASLTDAKLHIKGKLTVEGGLYTTKGGAEIIGTSGAMVTLAPGKETQIYQLRQSEGANAYQSIDVTSARLKNADGSYALTEHAADKSTYTCKEGCWTCGTWTLTEGVWSCTEASPHAALITQAEIPPTCEKDGTTAGAYCEVCGYIGSEAASIPMTGHSLPADWTITPATCTEDGRRTRKCQNAGCTYEEVETIEAQGHAWSEWTESRAASCTVAGEKTRACPCGEVETETLPALDHDWSAATCTASKACKTCGATEGNALGHTYRDEQGELLASEGEYTQYKCGQEIVITYTCTRCVDGDEGHTYEHQTGEMLEHDMAYEDEVPATCEVDGSAGFGRCTRGCGYTMGGTVLPALGHDWTPATCTAPKTCKREGCGITEGEALGHSWTPATCTDVKRCTTCKITEGEALGHDWAEATCTTPQTCKTCGATQGFELGHTIVIDAGKDPTCTESGLTEGSHCGVCGEVIVAQKTMSPMNHNWTPATCTTPKTCKREGCGITEGEALGHSWTEANCTDAKRCTTCKLTEGEALGHDWAEATCTTKETCKTCGATQGFELGHTTIIDAGKAPTCTETGLTEGNHCGVCGEVIVAQKTMSPMNHNWTPATCTTPKTCKREGCGITEGEALGHSWTEATCTDVKRCTTCKLTEGEALGHDWAEATCTTPQTCKTCGTTQGFELGHTTIIDAGKAPTCTEPGLTEGSHCSVCGEVIVAQKTMSPMNHNWTPATCTAPKTCKREGCGITEGVALGHSWTAASCTDAKRCTTCKLTEGEALGHDWVDADCTKPKTCKTCGATEGFELGHTTIIDAGKAPTCTEPGLTKGSHCSVCGEVIVAQKTMSPMNHNWTPATCTTPKTCKREGCGITEGEALGHSWTAANCTDAKRCTTCKLTEGEALGHDWVDADCTTPQTCKTCGATQDFELGHTTVIDAGKDPTCTESGLTEGSHCGVCGEVIVAQKTMSPMNHNWTPATCTTPKTCKREGCGITEGEALGHSWTEANCTDAKRCTTCKLTEGEALGHDWADVDCTKPKTCKTCGATQGFELGHTTIIDAGKAPTCTEPGLTEGSHCGVCGEVIVAQTVIEATAHANKYAGYGFEPDCTRAGCNAGLYCPDCDTWLEEQTEIPPLGHDLDKGVEAIPPTCTQSGVMAYPCQRCSYVASEDIPPRHTPVKIEAVSPTEDKEGATEGSKCSACGKILVQPEVIPALGRPTPEGWADEAGGWRYYADGAYLTGIAVVDGLYFDFGESGLNPDKTPYTGLLAVDGENYYIRKGKPDTGWQLIGESWYYFDTTTGAGLDGEHLVSGQVYPFEKGRLLHGVWVRDDVGLMYFYGPGNYDKGWQVIEGEEYFFQRGYVTTGVVPVQESQDKPVYWYAFTDAGVKLGYAADGFHWYEGELYYSVDGLADRFGMYCIDGDYYYFTYDDYAVRGRTFEVVQTNGLPVRKGQYRFDEAGRAIMTTEIVAENGKLVYYQSGVPTKNAGLVQVDNAYYYIDGEGVAVTNKTLLVEKTNGLVPVASYTFGADGRMQVRLPGDANHDYAVSTDDAATVFAYAAGQTVNIDIANADVNADGKVNEVDGLLIMQYAAGWEVVLR